MPFVKALEWVQLYSMILRAVVHFDALRNEMKTDLSMAELLALVEIVDEHVERNFPGIEPPRVLAEIQEKLDTIIVKHRREIDAVIRSARKPAAPNRKRPPRIGKKFPL
jgi:hypothetical protein